MTEIERIIRELEHAHGGDPWHGPSRASVLADVSLEEAARRPSSNGHSIWGLVLHMRAWTREVARRVREGAPRLPTEGDWPTAAAPTDEAWRAALGGLEEAHRDLLAAVRSSTAERLDARTGTPGAPDGSGVTCRVMLHGLAQHDAYHTGQISLLKRLYRDGAAS
jgi:uncharacterized damage-inducible protein DinB